MNQIEALALTDALAEIGRLRDENKRLRALLARINNFFSILELIASLEGK